MKKILIIENDENIVYAFNEILKQEGYIGVPSIPDSDAINKCWDENIKAVYVDITDPNVGDLETMMNLQNKTTSVPIFLISGQETAEKINEYKHLGYFESIEKPFSISAIRNSLHKIKTRSIEESLKYSKDENYNYMRTN